jgi:pyridoxine 5-phosphate synthase
VKHLDLSVNVDHVATLRNARGGTHPCPVEASRIAIEAGADGITVHLREDRRHIRDRDVERIRAEIAAPLNFEMAATEEMVAFAERIRPPYCCIVPEKRAELTTEGGLDVLRAGPFLREAVARLRAADVRVSIFIEADAAQIEAAAAIGALAIELHTGTYAEGPVADRPAQLARLQAGMAAAEISIGHFLISQSVFEGLPAVVRRFKALIAAARGA